MERLIQECGAKLLDASDTYDIVERILAENVGEEAFFIVDLARIQTQYETWTSSLPLVRPYYAVKCNPNPIIIKYLSLLGCHFDCASKNEISSVLDITEDPSLVIFANPCKMSGQIKYARAVDVDTMTFDSDHELYKIKLYHPNAQLIMRLKVQDNGSRCQFGCKFGCPKEQVHELLTIAKALSLNIAGFSFHVGSGCQDPELYLRAIDDCLEAMSIAVGIGFFPTIIDIGGGFEEATFSQFAKVIDEKVREHPQYQWIAEPGRFMVSSSHVLVVNVIGKKRTSEGFTYYLNDGVYGSFNCIFFDHAGPEVCPFNERDGPRYPSVIFGPTCDSLDKIAETQLPELAIGEWCYVENFGAYTQASSSSFNGFSNDRVRYVMTSTDED